MFGAGPQSKWARKEVEEFEQHAAERMRRMLAAAGWATGIFVSTILLIIPFLDGHSLHAHWESFGKYLLILAMGELVWIVMRWGFVYAAWQSAREVRREIQDQE